MSKTKDRIRESNLRYKQSLGQNFLYDEELLAALAEAAGVSAEEDVLEIGPGCGSLTKHLCRAAAHVLSVELDERLIPLLKAFMAEEKNLTVVQGDIMALDLGELTKDQGHNIPLHHGQGDIMALDLGELTKDLSKPFAVVANIPYYITTPLIQRLLSCALPVSRLALMVQKEVAEKILSSPGGEGWGPLAVRCQYMCEPYLAMEVPAACFTPPPKVDSAFIVLPLRDKPAVEVKSEEMFFRVAGAAFALRRKTMVNSLCAAFRVERAQALAWMQGAGLDEMVRGEKLTLEELAALADTVYTEKAE